MKERIKRIINTKQFHICMVGFIMFSILFVVGVVSLIYDVEGEGNLPFNLSKISIISSVEGTDIEDATNKWNLNISQNNDIYLHISKNDDYKNTEIIDSIKLDNFNIIQKPQIGEVKLIKPDSQIENMIFKNKVENEVNFIEFKGSLESNIKELKIANQGGLVVFRYAINNVGNYISNEDEEIKHGELLKKLSINNEQLKFKVSFDIFINLNSGKCFKSNVQLDLPINDVVSGDIQSVEYEDLRDIVFKRL